MTTMQIYPAYLYDPQGLLERVSFDILRRSQWDTETEEILRAFADDFNGEIYSREIVAGAGPYRLLEWIPNQQIVLHRKEAWWGHDLAARYPFVGAGPASLTYYIIPDAQTAITALKDGRVDVVADLTPEQYNDLLTFNANSRSLTLAAPTILQYYFVAYNNDHRKLGDIAVRRALSHLMPIDLMIEQLFFGLGQPTIGPVHPTKSYYHNGLKPLGLDPSRAAEMLASAGWADLDGNGILDKWVDGQKLSLKLEILTSRSQLSQDVAIMLKEQAEKVGFSLDIVPLDLNVLIQRTKSGQYDLSCLASIQEVGLNDFYNNWHSSSIGDTGNNYYRFVNEEADRLIEEIRITFDSARLDQLYRRFQEIIWEQQPALFLAAPSTRIAVRSGLSFETTVRRPGFFENTFVLN